MIKFNAEVIFVSTIRLSMQQVSQIIRSNRLSKELSDPYGKYHLVLACFTTQTLNQEILY